VKLHRLFIIFQCYVRRSKPSVADQHNEDSGKIIVPEFRAGSLEDHLTELNDLPVAETAGPCCETSLVGISIRRFTISGSLHRCLGDESDACSPPLASTDRSGSTRQRRHQGDPVDKLDELIKRTADSKLKTKEEVKQDYDLVFGSEKDGLNKIRIIHPMTDRQTREFMNGPERNWRNNMMRVWGRR